MKPKVFPLSPLARACAASVLCGTFATIGSQALAQTTAGTEIKNLATVTYEDAAGNVFSAQSNEAIVTVAQVYFATIGTDVDVTGAPGQTVYLPYILTNTGNGVDTYELSATDDISVADSTDAADIRVFRDTNGNGLPDAGEVEVTSVELAEGESTDLIVAVQVPTTSVAGNTLGVTLTAEAREGTPAAVAGSVTDATDATGGLDNLDGTVESLITVTNDAVLAMTKTSSHDAANNQITYTVTVTNNGNTAAQDVVIFDGFPEDTNFVTSSASVSGLLSTNNDTLATQVASLVESPTLDLNADGDNNDSSEATLDIDLNTDGDLTDVAVPGIYAIDAELAPNATVSMTFTVEYDPVAFGGGNSVDNVAYLSADTDGDGTTDKMESSNLTSDEIIQDFSLTLTDTGAGDGPLNDGGDDDATADDIQTVSSVASGGTVLFDVIVTNTGNGDDTFELSIDPDTFPAGTVFTFNDETGSVQLTDTNGTSGVDSGELAQDESRTIQVRAKLPQGISGPGDYSATVTATSSEDPDAAPVSDTTVLVLQDIVAPSADIHASTNGTIGSDENPLGTAPFLPAVTLTADAGGTVNIPVLIDNESGIADSFQLNAGSSFDAANRTVGALPPGWDVQFFLDDGAGSPTGPAITSTPTIPGGTTNFRLVAVVTLPDDASLAAADVDFDANGDGTATTTDRNNDGDGDYPLFMQIISANSGAEDTMMQAIDVNAGRAVAFTPSSSNQVEPGGTVEYPATLSNNGNSEETLEITSANSQPGFINTVAIDTDGNGTPDTVLANLVPSAIQVQLDDGSVVFVQVLDADGDGNPEFVLPPGRDLPLTVTVFAPANAPAGQVDTVTMIATNTDPSVGAPSTEVSFQSDVINGQVRLTKTAAIDEDCDGTPESAFQIVQNQEVEPEQCVIWRVVAENQGDVDARNVTITDTITAFSTYETGSLTYCITANCVPAPVTDVQTDDAGGITGSIITFYVGTGSNPAGDEGGTLIPGELATAQFTVKVE